MRKFTILIVTSVLFCFSSFAQNKHTLSGSVRDEETGEELIGATIIINEMSATGTSANAYGFYSITIPQGNYTVTAQFIGYQPKTISIALNESKKVDFILSSQVKELDEVVISSQRKDENITRTQMGIDKLDVKEIQNIPVLMGEKDILKTIQLLPGVKSAGEGNSGFYVRGGAADQNLILLDEATVYNASHLLGFFSVFNSDAIKDVTLYKGGMPSVYGGRLASVLDIKMKDGNMNKLSASGGIGLISSRLNIEGPIIKNKGSFIISARRTYADLFLKLSPDTLINKSRLYFYDINAKANYKINENNRIFLSGYFGKDVLGFGDTFGLNWGNATGTLRWNHIFGPRLFSNTSLIFSNYDYKINLDFGGNTINIISRIQDYNLKEDLQYYLSSNHTIKFGINSNYHKIIPGAITLGGNFNSDGIKLTNKHAWENDVYISHEVKVNPDFNVEYGLRLNAFSVLGPGNFYSYNTEGEAIDTALYSSGDFLKTYFNLQPRISASYVLNARSSVKASYGRNTQNLHLLSNSSSGNPTDLWIPSSINVKPEVADQVSLGYFRNFDDNTYEFSTEIYYKKMYNQIDYKNGAQLNFNETVESQLLFGEGRAYGIELFFKKRYGRFNGWIGYTLARSERKIPGINNDNYYPAKQDRTHDVALVGIYELAKKWVVSATWVYYTGNAVTFPNGKYEIDGRIFNYYSERNANRMPSYHRLDIGATWTVKKTEKFESSWNFSVYNAYGRKNAYTITFRENPDDPSRTEAIKTSLFTFVPSVTYNFNF